MIEKYHWTFDYLLWGISYTNVQMLLADSIQTFGFNDKDTGKGLTIDADDPRNADLIMNMIK